MSTPHPFPTISADDWKRSIDRARSEKNSISEQITEIVLRECGPYYVAGNDTQRRDQVKFVAKTLERQFICTPQTQTPTQR